ncbi:MAG: NAD(P)-dependent alcohol dehydrogenase [Desulfocapsaceae bacterium]|nr:NAD(P)-dependent alcohol dehydrogenase [Desulfocapsaceae bacterium]
MKAITYRSYGQPDVLRLEEVVKPIPSDNQLLIKIHAVSINSWDWDMLTGKPLEYRLLSGLFKPKSNLLHGCDISGTVEVVGRNVTRFKVGDEVFGDLSAGGWGAFAEYICVFEKELFLKPPKMTFAQAACLSHGGNLAVQGLFDFGRIASGQKVLINGGCGSTGTLAIQLAKLTDTDVTAVDNPDKLEVMRAIGADQVIDYTKEDFTKDGRQYDLIFDVNTNRPIADYIRALNPGGTYVTVGGKTLRILQLLLFRKFHGSYKLHMVGYKANKDLEYLVDLFNAGKIKPVIDKCFSLEETADAFRYFGDGSFKGKVVITLDQNDGGN